MAGKITLARWPQGGGRTMAARITAALDSAYDCDCREGWGEFGDALRAYAHRVALMVLGEVIAWGEQVTEGSERR